MRRKTHERVAVELARLLHLDERLVVMGARFPDIDRHVGRHRRTLHNPHVLALSSLVSPDFFVGVGSHLVLDAVSPLEKVADAFGKCLKLRQEAEC